MKVDSPEFLKNPYPFYAERRSHDAVFQRNDYEWTITGYNELSTFLAKSAAGRGNVGQSPRPDGDTSELDLLKQNNVSLQLIDRWMLFQNPPKHTATRGSIANVFTNKIVTKLEASIRRSLRELLQPISGPATEFDFVSKVAYPYPLTVITDLIGIPRESRNQFANWTRSLAVAAQADFHQLAEPVLDNFNQSATALEEYFKELLPQKIADQNDDLMTRFINENSTDLDAQELLANCVFLLFAGQDSTTCLITNAMRALLNNPDQWQLLLEQPELIGNAVEECLRYDPSIQMIGRFALDDMEIGDHRILKGHHIFAFLGAAGRDPLANANPDTFDVTRDNIKHLAFARGAHHCLGATLARLEMRIFLEELVDYLPTLTPAGNATRRPTWLMRGLDQLPVRTA